jgi:hypothetical protein
MVSQGGALLTRRCDIVWQGASSLQQATTTYEVSGCTFTSGNSYQLVGIGANCGAGSPWVSTNPDCTPGGSGGIQFTPKGITVTGPGNATDNGDGTFTMVRTGPGDISASYAYSELMCSGRGTRVVNATTNYWFAN